MARTAKTDQYSYILDWIREANDMRRAQNMYVERTILAYQGTPSQNYYKKSVQDYANMVYKNDTVRGKDLKKYANDIPEKTNMTLHNAVETVVSMAQGGVGRYEFGPYDPDMDKDDAVVDMLASAAKHFYNTEKVDAIMPQYIRNAVLSGAAWLHLKQKNKKKVLTLLSSDQMLTDPKRVKTNIERFRGHTQRESWQSIKSRTLKTKGGLMLKSINETDVYLSQILQQLNGTLEINSTQSFLHDEIRKDVDLFYSPIITRIKNIKEKNPEYLYGGDEVEISYIYDDMNDMYFEVVNRRYIVVAKQNDLKRKVKADYIDYKGKKVTRQKEICLDNPYVELPFLKTFWDTYPISPLFYVLDDFDDLCSQESVMFHNMSIMAPITFIGQSSDAEKVARTTGVAGEIVEGLPATFGVMNKTHDMSAIIAAIQRTEEKIKRIIGAMDPFEMQAMIGDRASAKEVTAMSGQISQRLNPFIANIEASMAELGEKFMKLHLIMNEGKYSFVHNGRYAELTPEDMAGDYEVQAKLSSSIKLEQEANSRKALEVIQYLGQTDKIDDKEFFSVLLPIVLSGTVTREQASRMIAEKYRPMDEETIASIRKKAENDAKRDPIDKLDLSALPVEELDDMIKQLSQTTADPMAYMDGSTEPQVQTPQFNSAAPETQFDEAGNVIQSDQAAADELYADPTASTAPAAEPTVPPEQVAAPQGGGTTITLNGRPVSGPSSPEVAGEVANDPRGTM